jgi:ubiquinone/menaquinone biosynthesis C-methylase UbiE
MDRAIQNIEANLQTWSDEGNWSEGGENWSQDWGGSENLWNDFIHPRIEGLISGDVVEIAVGYGRIVPFLLGEMGKGDKFYGFDINKNCIDECKDRFSFEHRASFYLSSGVSLREIRGPVGFVFSWDSLVHCDQEIVKSYILDIRRVLKPGAYAFLHHSRFADSDATFNPHWRDESCSSKEIADFAQAVGFKEVHQEFYAWGQDALTDCFTLLRR